MSERTTAEIVTGLKRAASVFAEFGESYGDANVLKGADLIREAADRLSRPRFTAEQVEAVAKVIRGHFGVHDRSCVTEARAALSVIGEVDDA